MERTLRLKSLGESHGMSALADFSKSDHIKKVWNDMLETYNALAMYKTNDEETRRDDWRAMREGFVSVLNDEAVYFHPDEPVFIAPFQAGERVCYTREFVNGLISIYGERMRSQETRRGVVVRPGVKKDIIVVHWDDTPEGHETPLHVSVMKRVPKTLIDLLAANNVAWKAYRDAGGPDQRRSKAGHTAEVQALWDAGQAAEHELMTAYNYARYHGGNSAHVAAVAEYFELDRREE